MKAAAAIPVPKAIAAEIADGRRDPAEFIDLANEGVDRLAKERGRHRSADAELSEVRPNAFGSVSLVFLAETEAD